MSIIRNLFGDKTPRNDKKANMNKFCSICTDNFVPDKSKINDSYCNGCYDAGRTANASFWRNELATKKANTLNPQMSALAEKLAQNKSLIEGSKIDSAHLVVSDRNIKEIRAASLDKTASFQDIKNQVAELLPGILTDLGISHRVNADLLLDAIVPAKIHVPIADAINGRAALRDIVLEATQFLNVDKDIYKESLIKTHGTVVTESEHNVINEGIHRVSSDYGNNTRKITASEFTEDHAFAPESTEPPADDAFTSPAESMADNESKVIHLPDEAADQLVQEKAMGHGLPTPEPQPEMLNEGIATHSPAENYIPDASNMGMDEGIKRVDNPLPDNVARKLQFRPVKTAKNKLVDVGLFTFANKLSKSQDLQIINVATKDRDVIDKYSPLNHIIATYSDGSNTTYKYYATDKGYMFVNADFVAHVPTTKKFAEFITSNSSFVKWAFMPEDFEDTIEKDITPDVDSVEDMALPDSADVKLQVGVVGEGDPGFNDIPETHLNPSNNNVIGDGLMNEEAKIFNNGDPDLNLEPQLGESELDVEPEIEEALPVETPEQREEMLLSQAAALMPHIQKMFPGESMERYSDLALESALNLLEKRAEDPGSLIGKAVGEEAKRHVPEEVANHFDGPTVRPAKTGYGLFEKPKETTTKTTGPRLDNSFATVPTATVNPNTAVVNPVSSQGKSTPGAFTGATSTNWPNLGKATPVKTSPNQTPKAVLPHTNPSSSIGGGNQTRLPSGDQMALAAALKITAKAEALMPYINNMYGDESESVRTKLALQSAYEFYKTAEPDVMEPPAAPDASVAPVVKGRGRPKGVTTQPGLGPDKVFPMVDPSHFHGLVQELGKSHPGVANIAGDPAKSMELAQHLSKGHYPGEYFGGTTSTTGPQLSMPASAKSHVPHFEKFKNRVLEHSNKLKSGEPMDDGARPSDATKAKLSKALGITEDRPSKNDALPVGGFVPPTKSGVPPDKQRNINQMLSLIKNQGHEMSPEVLNNYLENYHDLTPHLSPEQRTQNLPPQFHGQFNNVSNAIKQRDKDATGVTRDKEDFSQAPASNPIRKKLQESPALYDEETGGGVTPDEKARALRETDLNSNTGNVMQDVGDSMKRKRDDELAQQIKDEDRSHRASKVNEIRELTAEMSLDERIVVAESLMDMGYSENDILTAFAAECSDPKFTDKEHRQEKHIQESEEAAGKSPEEAERIGYATVNKQATKKKVANCDSDINGSTGAVAEVAKTFGECSEASRRGLKESKAAKLLKEALNPGGIGFNVSGPSMGGITNTRDPREQIIQTPSKTKQRQKMENNQWNSKIDALNDLNPDMPTDIPKKPAIFNTTTEHQRFKGPEQRRVKNKMTSYDKTPLSQNLEQLYPNLFPAPQEKGPNKLTQFVDWLKGVKDKNQGTIDSIKSVPGKIKDSLMPPKSTPNSSTGLSYNKIIQDKPYFRANQEIESLLKTALDTTDDYDHVITVMSELGYGSEDILKVFAGENYPDGYKSTSLSSLPHGMKPLNSKVKTIKQINKTPLNDVKKNNKSRDED